MALEPSTFVTNYRAWERGVQAERSAEVVPTPDKIAMTSMVGGTYYSTLNGRTLPLKTMLEWLAKDFSKRTDRDGSGRRLCLTEVFPLNDFNFFIDLDMKEVTLDDGMLERIVRCMIFTFVCCCAETSPDLSTIQVVVCTKVDEEGNLSCFEVETLGCPCCKIGKVVDDTKTPNVQRCVQCKATWTGENKFFTAPPKVLKAWHKSGAACTNPVPVMRKSVKTAAHIRFHNARVNSQTASILAEAIRVSCIEEFPQWADRWSSFIDCAPYRSTSSDTNSLRLLFTGKGDTCTKCRGASSSSLFDSSKPLALKTVGVEQSEYEQDDDDDDQDYNGGAATREKRRFNRRSSSSGSAYGEQHIDNDYDEEQDDAEEQQLHHHHYNKPSSAGNGKNGAARRKGTAALSCMSCGGSGRVTLDKQYAIWDIFYCTVDDAAGDGNSLGGEELAHRIATNPSLNDLAEEYERECSKTCEHLDDLAGSDALSSAALLASAAAASKSNSKSTGVSVDDSGNVSAKTPADLWGAVAVVRGVVAKATPLYERSRTRPKSEPQFLYCLKLSSLNLCNGGQARQLAVAMSSDFPIPVFAASIPHALKGSERARLAKEGLELGGLTMFDVDQQRQSGGWAKRVDSQFYELIIKTIRTATGKYRRAHVCNARWSPALDCVCCFIDGPGSTYCLNVKRNHSRSRAFAFIKRDGTLRMKCLSHNMPCGGWKGKVFRNIVPGAIRELFGVHQSVPDDCINISEYATKFKRLLAIKTGGKSSRVREYLTRINAHVRIMRSLSASCRYTANVKPVTLASTLSLIDAFVVKRGSKDHDNDDNDDNDGHGTDGHGTDGHGTDGHGTDHGNSAQRQRCNVRRNTQPAVQVSGGQAVAASRTAPCNATRSAYFDRAVNALRGASKLSNLQSQSNLPSQSGGKALQKALRTPQQAAQKSQTVETENDYDDDGDDDDDDDDSVANKTNYSESDNGDGEPDDGDEC